MRPRRASIVLASLVFLVIAPPTSGQAPSGSPMHAADPQAHWLRHPRGLHTATMLQDGRILVVGGEDAEFGAVTRTSEVRDPTTGTFTPTGPLGAPLGDITATLLPDGHVVVIGDDLEDGARERVESWDPATGAFSTVLASGRTRYRSSSTPLQDGRVLVVGGHDENGEALARAEILDPETGEFTRTGSLIHGRWGHTATPLPDGRVLVIGGFGDEDPIVPAETWDPATGEFSPAGRLRRARVGHTANLLADGRVLVLGGPGQNKPSATAEVWDPATATFARTGSLAEARDGHTATLLDDGRVLVAGGYGKSDDDGPTALATAEVWDPATGEFVGTDTMSDARGGHTATRLPDGAVLVIGGYGPPHDGYLRSTERWDAVTEDFGPAPATGGFASPGPDPSAAPPTATPTTATPTTATPTTATPTTATPTTATPTTATPTTATPTTATPTTATLTIRDCQTAARAWRGRRPPANDRRTGELTGTQGARLRAGDEVTVQVPPVAAGSYDSGCSGRSDFRWYRLRAIHGAPASGWVSAQAIAGAPGATRTEPVFPDWGRPRRILERRVTDLAIDRDGTIVTVTETDEGIVFATDRGGSWTRELIKAGAVPNARTGVFHVGPRVAVDRGRVAVVFDSMQQEGPGDCAPGPCWDRVATTVMIENEGAWSSRRLKRTAAGPIVVRGRDVYVTDGRHLASRVGGRWREEDVPARYRHAAHNWQRVSHLAVSADGVVHVAAMDYLGPEIGYARKDASGWESRRIPTDVGTLMGIAATRGREAVIGYASGRDRFPDDLCGGDCATFESFHLLTVTGSETRDRVVPGEGWGVVASDPSGHPIVVRWSSQGIVWRRWVGGVWQTIDWQVRPWEGSFSTHFEVGGMPPHGLWAFAGRGAYQVAYEPGSGGTWLVEGNVAR